MGTIDFSKWVQPAGGGGETSYPVLDIYGEDDPLEFLFTLNDTPFMACGNIQTVKGRMKSGKSALGVALMVAALCGEFAGVKANKENIHILWVDTEQDNGTLRKRAQAVLSMAGMEGKVPNNLTIVPLRPMNDPKQRVRAIDLAIEAEHPDFIFLDGVKQLCKDFNDSKESTETVESLMTYSDKCKCALLGVIHTNKKDDEARGHLGTMLEQQSSEVYELSRNGDITIVKQPLCRFKGVQDFKLRFVDDFKLEPAGRGVSDTEAKVERMKKIFGGICGAKKEWRYKDLVSEYEQMEGVGSNMAKKAISTALDMGVLFKNGAGRDTVYTYLFPKMDDDLL